MLYLAIALAGSAGAIIRALLAKSITLQIPSTFPVATLVVNLTGSFILGFFLTISARRLKISSNLRLAVSTGFLGSYTTFSAFALESVNLLMESPLLSMVYIVSTSLGCVLLAFLGLIAAQTIIGQDKEEPVQSSEES